MLVLSAVWDLTITAKSLDMEVLCLLGKLSELSKKLSVVHCDWACIHFLQ